MWLNSEREGSWQPFRLPSLHASDRYESTAARCHDGRGDTNEKPPPVVVPTPLMYTLVVETGFSVASVDWQ